jgi:hypothetical protein
MKEGIFDSVPTEEISIHDCRQGRLKGFFCESEQGQRCQKAIHNRVDNYENGVGGAVV